ncbi:MAG: hypothetical protein L0312_06685, partial [Acidobacteria bacterium]|nr:hypothetical protein [Acidobacteriota bacterium]
MFDPTIPHRAVGSLLGASLFDGEGPGQCNRDIAKSYLHLGAHSEQLDSEQLDSDHPATISVLGKSRQRNLPLHGR